MAVKLRLARHGAKKKAYYRIVAAEDTAPRDGRFLEHIGSYDPNPNPPAVQLKRDRIRHWLSQGAAPTPTVKSLLKTYLETDDSVRATRNAYVPTDAPEPVAAEPAPAPATEAPAAEAAAPVADSDES